MPANLNTALNFLETQWSSITENKTKGVLAEIRFISYLNTASVLPLYDYIIPGGWIITPSKNTIVSIPTNNRIVIIPNFNEFSWTGAISRHSLTAQVIAHSYFRQAGMHVYFADIDVPITPALEVTFQSPSAGSYPTTYDLVFKKFIRMDLSTFQ